MRFLAPNTVVIVVKGKDTRPFPDVSLTTTVTDMLSVQGNGFNCTTRSHTNANTFAHKALFAASILTAPANFGVPAAAFGAQLGLIGREVAAENRKPADRGPGCQLLDKVFRAGSRCQTAARWASTTSRQSSPRAHSSRASTPCARRPAEPTDPAAVREVQLPARTATS